jgi:hypothetical protein
MKISTVSVDLLDFVDELGDRFPDKTDGEVIFACEEFLGKGIKDPNVKEVLLTAYDTSFETAKSYATRIGVIVSDDGSPS